MILSKIIDNTYTSDKKRLLEAIVSKIYWEDDDLDVEMKYHNNRNYSTNRFCSK